MQKGVNYGNQNMLGKVVFYRLFFSFLVISSLISLKNDDKCRVPLEVHPNSMLLGIGTIRRLGC